MPTIKQVQANRENSLKSTGPKTQGGKAVVGHNAFKHGILSGAIIDEAKKLGESKKDFDSLKERLNIDLEPAGILEEILVDKLAVCYWRLRRVIWAENGALRLQTDSLWYKDKIRLTEEAIRYRDNPYSTKFLDRLKNSVSNKWTIDELRELKKTVEEVGYLPEAAFKKYVQLKNLLNDEDEFAGFDFFNEAAQGNIEEEPDKEKGKKGLLYLLDEDVKRCESMMDVTKELEEDYVDAKGLSLSIPDSDSVDKILRYETSIENQLYRAMNQLIKLQTLRKGGRVVSASMQEIELIEG